MKRVFDLTFAAVGLVVLSPVLLALAVAVKLSSRGPVLFRQERVGQGGRAFYIVKFRSMVANAENAGPSITPEGDPRVTRMGRFLRRTKLDELPQLWNVLVGEMSFVGPRPEVPKYVAQYTPEQRRVLELKPGITDLATLEFRKEEEMLRRRTEDGGRRTEGGGRCVGGSEDGGRRTAREKAEGRMQNAEVGNIEDGGRRTEDGRQKTDHGPLTTGPRRTEDGGRCVGEPEDGERRTESRETTDHGPQTTEDGRTEDGTACSTLNPQPSTLNQQPTLNPQPAGHSQPSTIHHQLTDNPQPAGQPSTISSALEKYYLEYCVPRKIELNLEYAKRANVWQDVLIILRTVLPFCDAILRIEDGGRRTEDRGRNTNEAGLPRLL